MIRVKWNFDDNIVDSKKQRLDLGMIEVQMSRQT